MDLAFLLRAERMLNGRADCAVDYGVLVAALSAHQQASATARAAAVTAHRRGWERPHAPLVELLVGGRAWREAGRVQSGSFNRAIARAASIGRQPKSPPRLPSHFSLPSTLPGYSAVTEEGLPGGQGIL